MTVELRQWLRDHPGPYDNVDSRPGHDRNSLLQQERINLVRASGGIEAVQEYAGPLLRLLMMMTGLVLLIACANVANLLLARGVAARTETAVRLALGAPRRRLITQALMESVLLAIAGGAAGLLIAYSGAQWILLIAFRGVHYMPFDVKPSALVLAFALGPSLATGILFGLAPAWIRSGADPAEALRGAGRSTGDRSSALRRSFVIAQVVLSTVLLMAAGLFTRTFHNLTRQNFGFDTRGRVIVSLNPALAGYQPDRLFGLYQQFQTRLSSIPGVLSASYSQYSPMEGTNWANDIYIPGRPPAEHDNASFVRIGPHYLETIGTPMLRGRTITEQDTPTSLRVAVVNETFARKFFANEDALGKHFGMTDPSHSHDFEIVGIVADAKYQDARRAAYPTFFLPFLQASDVPLAQDRSQYAEDLELLVARKLQNLEPLIRRLVADIDPNLTVTDIRTLEDQVANRFGVEFLLARLADIFGLLAVVLASVGLYGVTSYAVARRTNEIGIRIALGAGRGRVLSLVLRGALTQVAVGLAIGIPATIVASRLIASQLYGVKGYDPEVLVITLLILAVCGVLAAFIPARRSASIDPMRALRTE